MKILDETISVLNFISHIVQTKQETLPLKYPSYLLYIPHSSDKTIDQNSFNPSQAQLYIPHSSDKTWEKQGKKSRRLHDFISHIVQTKLYGTLTERLTKLNTLYPT